MEAAMAKWMSVCSDLMHSVIVVHMLLSCVACGEVHVSHPHTAPVTTPVTAPAMIHRRVPCPAPIRGCKCRSGEFDSYHVDCSRLNLTRVPYGLPSSTTHLLLHHNNITTLQNDSFLSVPELVWLDVSVNAMRLMQSGSLQGLRSLRVLIISHNLLMDKTHSFAQGVFQPVAHTLEELDIRRNLNHVELSKRIYPGRSLSCLDNLRTLRMDLISNMVLPKEFSDLEKLESLDFSCGTVAEYMPSSMFHSVAALPIKMLNLTNVMVAGMSPQIFDDLKHLEVLDLSNNINLKRNMLQIVQALTTTKIKELYLTNTQIGIISVNYTNEIIWELRKSKNMKVLSLDQNEISFLSPIFSKSIPNIEILSLRRNEIYEHFPLIQDFMNLTKLRILDISFQNTPSHFRRQINAVQSHNTKVKVFGNSMCLSHEACPLKLPLSLEKLYMSNNGIFFTLVPEVVLLTNGSLSLIDASNNGIKFFPKPFYCGPNVVSPIQTVDVSNCQIECINKTFFKYCLRFNLKNLFLGQNKIGSMSDICNHNPKEEFLSFLEHPVQLEKLDLSRNNIANIFNGTFKALTKLRHLNMSGNKLKHWKADIRSLVNIEMLDISNNFLKSLPRMAMQTLDQLQAMASRGKRQRLIVDLSGNELQCVCSNLEFIWWLRITNVSLLNIEQYKCIDKNGKKHLIGNIHKTAEDLLNACTDSNWLYILLIGTAVYTLMVSLLTLLYRYRHDIHYIVLKRRMMRERLASLAGNRPEFEFDAFVSCAGTGVVWVKDLFLPKLENKETEMRFCIAQRNFIAGRTIMSNIMSGINSSKKVVFIVSKHFVQSNWCKEELIIGHQESLSRGSNIAIVVFLPDVLETKLPTQIRFILRNITCMKWSPNPKLQKLFWVQLQRALVA